MINFALYKSINKLLLYNFLTLFKCILIDNLIYIDLTTFSFNYIQ